MKCLVFAALRQSAAVGRRAAREPLAGVFRSLLCLCALSSLLAHGASEPNPVADDEFTRMTLDDLMHIKLRTATQVATDPFSLPFMTTGYDRQSMETTLPRTLSDLFLETPGVMVQKTTVGQPSPYIRGFTGFRTLLLVDGIRINNSVFREGPNQYWNTVDLFSLERVEIVKGPGSVLYGSDAIGGTVNALTWGGQNRRPGEGTMGTFYRFGSADASHIARAEFSGALHPQLDLNLGGTWKTFDDLRGGHETGRQRKTGYDEYDLDAKASYLFRTNVQMVLAHQTVEQDDIWRAHSTIYGSTWEDLTPGNDQRRSIDQHRQLTYAQLHAAELPAFVEQMHVSLSHQYQGEDQVRVRSNGVRDLASLDVHTLGCTLQLESPSPIGYWVYGSTYYRDWVDSAGSKYKPDGSFDREEIQGPVADNASSDLVGVYAQNQLPSLGPIDFTIRGRFDHAAVEASEIQDPLTGLPISFANSWDSAVGGGRALVHVDDSRHWNVFTGIGQGFRAPNLSDLTRLDAAGTGQIETPSTDVRPEYFTTYEAGLKGRYARVEMEAAYFYTDIQEMILRRPTGRTINGLTEVTKENSGNGFVHGVELDGTLQLSSEWSARASFTWMAGEIDSFGGNYRDSRSREPLSRLMPTTGHLGLHWEHPQKRFWADLSCSLATRQDELASVDLADNSRIPPDGTPGYMVGTVRAGWRINKHASISAALENLADTDYRIHGSGVNEPGRNLVIGANLRF